MQTNSFRTAIQLQPLFKKLKPRHEILSLGSCFAANMGQQLVSHKFNTHINPGGTLFNPISMIRLARMALDLEPLTPFRQAEHLPVWHHFDLHSDMSRTTQKEAQENLKHVLTSLKKRLQTLDWLILTFGTARVYTWEGQLVANCHKYPHHFFERQLLTLEEMQQRWQSLYPVLMQHRPNLQILLTVSPVRHNRDGLAENSVSKALLRVFCEQLVSDNTNIHYFPAYEMMLDDLRDYRFYAADMIHPTETAQDYIWQAFQQTVMDEAAQEQVQTWAQIRRDLNHRPNYPGSPGHVQFLQSIQTKLQSQPDYLDTKEEQRHLEKLLQSYVDSVGHGLPQQ